MANKKVKNKKKMAKKKKNSFLNLKKFNSKTMLLFALVFGLVGGAVLIAAYAAPINGPSPFAWGTTYGGNGTYLVVEQQSPTVFSVGEPACSPEAQPGCVYNHTTCNWDVDDINYIGGYGTLTGSSGPVTQCLIADGTSYPGPYNNNKTLKVTASANSALTVTLTNSLGVTVPVTETYAKHTWAYRACTVDLTPGNDPAGPHYQAGFPEIPGSNGGRGVKVVYSLTVSSPKKATVRAELYNGNGGC